MRFMAGHGLAAAGSQAQSQQAGHGQVGGARGTCLPGRATWCAKGHPRGVVLGSAQRGADVGGDGCGGPVGVLHRTVSAGKAGPMVVPLAGCGSAESRREAVFPFREVEMNRAGALACPDWVAGPLGGPRRLLKSCGQQVYLSRAPFGSASM